MPLDSLRHRLSHLLPAAFRAYVASFTAGHRRFVGPGDRWDLAAASQFSLLTLLGLREHHTLLDVGCGSLRAGRLFVVYLQAGHYFGVEPERWLVDAAIRSELGAELVARKRPTFHHGRDFAFGVFGRTFDFLLANSIFSHASPAQIGTCLAEAARVMTPASIFLASYVDGPTDYTGDAWVYPGTVTYTLPRLQALAAAAGLTCERLDWPYVYGEGAQTWLALTRRDAPT